MKPIDRIVWVDLETTGLDPRADQILEVAVAVTDRDLEVLTEYSWVVKPAGGLRALHPVVLEMHSKNGLLSELHAGTSLHDVDVRAAALVRSINATGGPIGGSSPHFDRSFIHEHMPLLDACFSHRVFDVSTLKQAWCNQFQVENKDEPAHRALADIRQSIALAKTFTVR